MNNTLHNNIAVFCSKCGTKLNDGAEFCHKCGKHIIDKLANPYLEDEEENTSGNGKEIPSKLNGLSWGGFFLTPFWALANKNYGVATIWIVLWVINLFYGCFNYSPSYFHYNYLYYYYNYINILIFPIVINVIYLILSFFVLFTGYSAAWKSRRFDSAENFRQVQSIWNRWGIGLFIASIVISIIVGCIFGFALVKYFTEYEEEPKSNYTDENSNNYNDYYAEYEPDYSYYNYYTEQPSTNSDNTKSYYNEQPATNNYNTYKQNTDTPKTTTTPKYNDSSTSTTGKNYSYESQIKAQDQKPTSEEKPEEKKEPVSVVSNEISVPNLNGLTFGRAKNELERIGLSVSWKKTVNNEKYNPDTVISSEPEYGTKVKPGSGVVLVVAK